MSAGFSPAGRDFAARAADVLFLNVTELDQVRPLLTDVEQHMARYGRSIRVFTMGHVVCRPTRKEAEDYFHYFAEEMADTEGQAYYRSNRGATVPDAGGAPIARPFENRFTRATGLHYAGGYPGAYPFVGSPDDIADEMARMSAEGLAGCTVAFVDYLKEIPYFVQEVLPRLERTGGTGEALAHATVGQPHTHTTVMARLDRTISGSGGGPCAVDLAILGGDGPVAPGHDGSETNPASGPLALTRHPSLRARLLILQTDTRNPQPPHRTYQPQ